MIADRRTATLILLSVAAALVAKPANGQNRSTGDEVPGPRARNFSWRETETTIALLNHGKILWQHVHDRKSGKPFLRIGLLDGTELTRPWPFPKDYPRSDHVWHKALWWSWKYIDGINFWEENHAGTDPVEVRLTRGKDGAGTIHMKISYHLPGNPPLLTEKRTISIGAPNAKGSYLIDWRSTFRPSGKKKVVFNQNSYGGLALRMAAEYCGDPENGKPAWKFIRSKEKTKVQKNAARWMAYQGVAQNGQPTTIAMFSHPDNPRYPALWQTRNHYPYLNPSFTCEKDYTLDADRSLTLRYGVLIHAGAGEPAVIERAWKAFADRANTK